MLNAIDEILAYEKQAKQIVDNAKIKSEEIIAEAEKQKEEIRLAFLAEGNKEVEKYNDDVEKTGREHIHHTMDMRDDAVKHIDEIFNANSEAWLDEIFLAVIGN